MILFIIEKIVPLQGIGARNDPTRLKKLKRFPFIRMNKSQTYLTYEVEILHSPYFNIK